MITVAPLDSAFRRIPSAVKVLAKELSPLNPIVNEALKEAVAEAGNASLNSDEANRRQGRKVTKDLSLMAQSIV